MAERCAGCGAVGNYVQAGANALHCVKCGETTEIATGQLLPKAEKGPLTSNDGHVVRELSSGGNAGGAPARVDASFQEWQAAQGAGAGAVDVAERPGIPDVMAGVQRETIDLAELSEEQAEAIHRIVGD